MALRIKRNYWLIHIYQFRLKYVQTLKKPFCKCDYKEGVSRNHMYQSFIKIKSSFHSRSKQSFRTRKYSCGSRKSFQPTYNLTHSWAFLGLFFNTPLNKPSQGTILYLTYLITDLLGTWLFSDAHFTQQDTKAINVHLMK